MSEDSVWIAVCRRAKLKGSDDETYEWSTKITFVLLRFDQATSDASVRL